MTDDEAYRLLKSRGEDADAWLAAVREGRAQRARAAHEADELFKHRLILVVIVVIFIILFVLPSPSVQAWLNAPPDCYDRSCFGGGA